MVHVARVRAGVRNSVVQTSSLRQVGLDCGCCGDREFWAVDRIFTYASDWVSDFSSGWVFPL